MRYIVAAVSSLTLMALLARNVSATETSPPRKQTQADRAREEVLANRIATRVGELSKQFPIQLRMVIGGPCYMWGIDAQISADLKAAGMDVLAWPDAPLIDPDQIRGIGRDPLEYSIIIFGDPLYHLVQPDPNTGEIPQRIKDQVPLLRRFLAAGGGIWFSGIGEQNWGRSSHALNHILRELDLGAKVVGEVVMDTAVAAQGSRLGDYAWVDVSRNPLTQGVQDLLHPGGVISGEGSMGVVPIVEHSPEWHVLLRGKPSAASFPCDQTVPEGKLLGTPGVVKSSPVLAAVRQAGKGRVVLWPTWSNFTVTGGSGGKLVDGDKDGRWSDGARLIENLLCWLAEPSQDSRSVGTFDPEKYEWARSDVDADVEEVLAAWRQPGRRDYANQYKGLIGVHSNLSDGVSPPGEMIAAARQAGYDFIAFTEDFAGMDEAKWKRLLAECDEFNDADSDFIAYAGLDFLDESGNRGMVFGHRFWIKDEWRSERDPDRIRWWYNLAYAADADAHRWPPRVIVRSKTNNKRPWNQGLWSFLGTHCYEGGRLVDESLDEWFRLIGRHVFFLNTGVMAVHAVRSVEEIDASSRRGLYQTHVRAKDLRQVLSRLRGCTGPMVYFPSYVSAGPEIVDFRTHAAVMGGEISFVLARPGNDRGLLHILVRSDVGLKEVAVHDGTRLVRRFLPDGDEFETFMTFHADSCHAFCLTVTDTNGHKAVSWPAYLQIQEWVHRRCGDNWNWMRTGTGPGSLIPPEFTYQLHEVTHGWTSKAFVPSGERKGETDRPRYQCEQGNYGHGGLSGAINGYIRPQGLLVEGKAWPSTHPAMTLDFVTNGRFGTILTNIVREDMLVPKLEPYTIGAFSGPYDVVTSPWPAELEQHIPFGRPDGASINRYRGTVTFTKEVRTPDGGPIRLRQGATGKPGATALETMTSDGVATMRRVGAEPLVGLIPLNGYICWYDERGEGVGGIVALSPGVHYSYSREWQECWVETASPAEPGTQVTWDVLFVTGSGASVNSNAEMETVRLGMGISGEPTLYEVHPTRGRVVDRTYCLTLQAEDHGFAGRVVKTSRRPLPIHLPVFVKGLNPRWTAVIWYPGRTHLHTPRQFRDRWGVKTWRWKVAEYLPFDDAIRYIPVLEDGRGYCQIDTDKQDPDIFIGNPLVCEEAEIFLTLVRAGKSACTFEINNPTDAEVACTVRPANGFTLTGRWARTLTLAPGAAETVTVR